MKVEKIRDLTLIGINETNTMVIACDSCGGVGMKKGDVLEVDPYYAGRFTARVGILEVMCAGAEIVTVADTICNEMEPTGSKIIKGIKEELKAAGVNEVVLTGSTEENFPTVSTALGVTVIGIAENSKLKVKKINDEAVLFSVGIPKVGAELKLDNDRDIVDYAAVKQLLGMKEVLELIPVGSKGILYEAQLAADYSRMRLITEKNISVNVTKSAGPATCVIAAVGKGAIDKIKCLKNMNIIGTLVK